MLPCECNAALTSKGKTGRRDLKIIILLWAQRLCFYFAEHKKNPFVLLLAYHNALKSNNALLLKYLFSNMLINLLRAKKNVGVGMN